MPIFTTDEERGCKILTVRSASQVQNDFSFYVKVNIKNPDCFLYLLLRLKTLLARLANEENEILKNFVFLFKNGIQTENMNFKITSYNLSKELQRSWKFIIKLLRF